MGPFLEALLVDGMSGRERGDWRDGDFRWTGGDFVISQALGGSRQEGAGDKVNESRVPLFFSTDLSPTSSLPA